MSLSIFLQAVSFSCAYRKAPADRLSAAAGAKKPEDFPFPSGSSEEPVIRMGTIGCSSCPSAHDQVQESFFAEIY
jgi:hypothetical protein